MAVTCARVTHKRCLRDRQCKDGLVLQTCTGMVVSRDKHAERIARRCHLPWLGTKYTGLMLSGF